MNTKAESQAWADFWREDQARGGCLSNASAELEASVALWHGFAASLPAKAKVLDLGTGDGAVLKQLGSRRRDLRMVGVDSAPLLPPAKGKMRLQANVAMEALPFQPAAFDAVVSQFGYEYGDTTRAAPEVRRVLSSGGRFLFLVHHRDGPVVSHNRRRAEALGWILDGGLLDRARSLASTRQTLPLPTPPSFAEAVREADSTFGQSSVAAEITRAIWQALAPGPSPRDSLDALGELERKAKSELLRLKALDAAARDDTEARQLVEELRGAGLEADDPGTLNNRSGQPYAWTLAGRG